MTSSEEQREQFNKTLLDWWKTNKRDFPWRHTRDPYTILIAELLLRKTTAKQVSEVYPIFIKIYSSPDKLHRAETSDIKKMIATLGIEHKRAELFKKFGTYIVTEVKGKIPYSKDQLLRIPGVGEYAANAVLSFSCGEDVPTVDTNFIRLIERFFGIKSEKKRARTDRKIWDFAQQLVPTGRSRDFNLAVLDFCAVVCTARKPHHSECPLSKLCDYYIEKRASRID